jgi:hypothetical protein
MGTPLIAVQRAVQSSALAALNKTNPAQLASLIDAASDAIKRHCHRNFVQTTYTEYYSGAIYIKESLKLRNFPVQRIGEISTANVAMQVLNSGGSVQKATVETLPNGDFQLITTASGVVTTNVLPAATYITIGAMAAAINALGNGWGTSILSGASGSYANFPTTDLKTLQGACSALIGGCWLEIYENWYGWNTMAFWPDQEQDSNGVACFWRLDNESGEVWGRLPRGRLNLRINYTAGYSVIPASVQQACADLTQWLYQQGQANQAIKEAKLGNSSFMLNESAAWPPAIRDALSYFVAHDRVIYWD